MSYDEEYWFDKKISYHCDGCDFLIEQDEDIISFNKTEYLFCSRECMEKFFIIEEGQLTTRYVDENAIMCQIEYIERTPEEKRTFRQIKKRRYRL